MTRPPATQREPGSGFEVALILLATPVLTAAVVTWLGARSTAWAGATAIIVVAAASVPRTAAA